MRAEPEFAGDLRAGTSVRSARLRIGHLSIDSVTFAEALDRVADLVESGRGGAVHTPNVDHVVMAEDDAAFREAYAAADLSLVDGQPLVWSSRLLRRPLPAKISGSDFTPALLELAASRGWGVFLLGGADGVAEQLSRELPRRFGVRIAGSAAPRISIERGPAEQKLAGQIRASGARLILVALGAPKQELWIHRWRGELGGAVCVAVGASLDFLAGRVRRAPGWISRAGLEWLFRLVQEPRRLARRYLVRDPRYALILVRTLLRG